MSRGLPDEPGGDYAYVIGSETQKAGISRVPGATFLPFSTTQTTRLYILLLRNKLINPGFTHSAQNITHATDPSAASAAMGPYYPEVLTCALSTLAAKGLSRLRIPLASRRPSAGLVYQRHPRAERNQDFAAFGPSA